MKFPQVDLEVLSNSLIELPSTWMDDTAIQLLEEIELEVPYLRSLGRPMNSKELEVRLSENPVFVDLCRLFLGEGQDPVANKLREPLGLRSLTWDRVRRIARKNPHEMAKALSSLGVPETIFDHVSKEWQVEDILIDRYRLMRGRAIQGQVRGHNLEAKVEAILESKNIPFEARVTFTGKRGITAKCDIAIPSRTHPKIVIEVKAFESTGSKLTDFLGDVRKILEAKESQMYFLIVTDGRGWHNRLSDLRKLVEFQNAKDIDMIYSTFSLSDLAAATEAIYHNE